MYAHNNNNNNNNNKNSKSSPRRIHLRGVYESSRLNNKSFVDTVKDMLAIDTTNTMLCISSDSNNKSKKKKNDRFISTTAGSFV